MNRENNAPFADRAPREDGKPAFRGNAHGEGRRPMSCDNNAPFADRATREDGKPTFRGNAHGEGRRPMNRDNNAPFADRVPREDGKPAFRGNAHGEGRRPMNPDNNALFADRAPREDGKPAFHRDTHGASRGICKSNLKNGFPTRSSESPGGKPFLHQRFAPARPAKGCGHPSRGKRFLPRLARAVEESQPLRVPWEDAVAFHAESGFLISRERRKNFDRYASHGRMRSPFTRKAAFAISASGSSTWESE